VGDCVRHTGRKGLVAELSIDRQPLGVEAFRLRRLSRVEQRVAEIEFPGHGQGLEGLRQRVNTLRTAFTQQFTLELLIAEGDKVAVLWTTRGTHVGEFMGLPPTGKSYTIQGVDIHQLRDGRMTEHWDVVDVYSMLIQLGALPAPSGAPA